MVDEVQLLLRRRELLVWRGYAEEREEFAVGVAAGMSQFDRLLHSV